MRSFEDWEERFRAFWTVSPHLNVISIKEVYDAGSKLSPVVIVPIELSLDDIDDILSYVSKIKPKDLETNKLLVKCLLIIISSPKLRFFSILKGEFSSWY